MEFKIKPSDYIFFVIAFFVATMLLVALLIPFFIGDEANYVNCYFEFLKTGRPDIYGELVVKPPGMFILSAPFLSLLLPLGGIFGIPIELVFRLVDIIFAAASLYVLYLVVLKLQKSELVAAFAVLFFSLFANFFVVSAIYYPDVFLLLFSFLAFYALLERRDLAGSALAALFTAIAFYIKLEQAFLVFALIIPHMLIEKKVRLDYFALCFVFCAIAALVMVLPYYPARLTQFGLLVQTEVATRVPGNLVMMQDGPDGGVMTGLAHLVRSLTSEWNYLAFLLIVFCLVLEKAYLKGESLLFEKVGVLLLLPVLALGVGWYTAIFFFGLSVFAARICGRAGVFGKLVFLVIAALLLFESFLTVYALSIDTTYDFASQKSLGVFLKDKHPITFVTGAPTMRIWEAYGAYYGMTNSPVLLANARMCVLPYKFLYEGGGNISAISAVYTRGDGELSNLVFKDRYVVVEEKDEKQLESALHGYRRIAVFGTTPGFRVYERAS